MSGRRQAWRKAGKQAPKPKAARKAAVPGLSRGRVGSGSVSGYGVASPQPMQIKDYSADRYASVEPGWLRDARDTKEELPFRRAEDLAHKLNMSASQFGVRLLDISPSTVRRRRHNNKLTPGESTKVLRYFHIQRLATGLMEGDETAARQWLFSPLAILGGDPPLEHARTEVGAREVEQLIGRIEHGVYC